MLSLVGTRKIISRTIVWFNYLIGQNIDRNSGQRLCYYIGRKAKGGDIYIEKLGIFKRDN